MQNRPDPQAGGLIRAEDSLLLIVDVQEKLLPAIQGQEQVRQNIIRLGRFAQIMSMPVLACEQVKLGPTVPDITAALPGVQPIAKASFNCFGSPEFRAALKELGKTQLIIAGIEAHVCVLQTAISGVLEYGWRVQVLMDATGSRSSRNLELVRGRFLQTGVGLSSTEMFVFECLERAGTEAFTAALPLLKA